MLNARAGPDAWRGPLACRVGLTCQRRAEGDTNERPATEVPRGLRPQGVLPHQPDAHLLRLPYRVQPARHGPLGAELPLCDLLRLLRGQPPERIRARGPAGPG